MVDIAYALRLERDGKISRSLYDWTQVNFSYNSNHMEGTTLTLGQTSELYATNSFIAEDNQKINPDDSIETGNHFKLFDYMLDTVDQPLSPAYIAKLQGILKARTSDENNPIKVVGDFKKYPNVIGDEFLGGKETVAPGQVKTQLTKLIEWWKQNPKRDLAAFAEFHYRFESIHPFSDGNGRIGRMLLFKERCRARKIPFVILDEDRAFYLRGLREFKKEPGYLIDTLGSAMDTYEAVAKQVYGEKLERLPQRPPRVLKPKPRKR